MSDMVPIKYLFDSNVFIQAYKLYYQFHFCPAFWDWLLKLNKDCYLSIDKVYDELTFGSDDLASCAKDHKKLFVKCDSKSLLILPQIQKLLKEEKVPDNKIREFIELPVADAYLISYAKTHNCILVTHEEPANKINAKKKVHIPDVCNAMGVQYTSIYEIMRKERDYHMNLTPNK